MPSNHVWMKKNNIIKWRVSGRDHSKRQFGNLTTCNSAWMTKGVHHLGPIKGKKAPEIAGGIIELGETMWSEDFSLHCRGDAAANDIIGLRLFTGSMRDDAALWWWETEWQQRRVQSHTEASPSLPLTARGDQATVNGSFMPGWPGSSRGCGGPLNVSALSLSLLSLLAESSDHSVSPFPGSTVSAASGWRAAETFPQLCQRGF